MSQRAITHLSIYPVMSALIENVGPGTLSFRRKLAQVTIPASFHCPLTGFVQ